MKAAMLIPALALGFLAGAALAPGAAQAANADHPYSNVDRHVDAGNDTGDARTDDLNSQQLDQNYYHTHPGGPPGTMAPPPGAMPPPPPPPGY